MLLARAKLKFLREQPDDFFFCGEPCCSYLFNHTIMIAIKIVWLKKLQHYRIVSLFQSLIRHLAQQYPGVALCNTGIHTKIYINFFKSDFLNKMMVFFNYFFTVHFSGELILCSDIKLITTTNISFEIKHLQYWMTINTFLSQEKHNFLC